MPSKEGRGPGLGCGRKLETHRMLGWPAGEQAARGPGITRTGLPPLCLPPAPCLHAFGSQSLEAGAQRPHGQREPGRSLHWQGRHIRRACGQARAWQRGPSGHTAGPEPRPRPTAKGDVQRSSEHSQNASGTQRHLLTLPRPGAERGTSRHCPAYLCASSPLILATE